MPPHALFCANEYAGVQKGPQFSDLNTVAEIEVTVLERKFCTEGQGDKIQVAKSDLCLISELDDESECAEDILCLHVGFTAVLESLCFLLFLSELLR